MFAETNVQITARDQWHLGAALGFLLKSMHVTAKIELWAAEVSALARVAIAAVHTLHTVHLHIV